jgi:hypothetical protein
VSRPITYRRDGDALIPFGVGMQKRFDEDFTDGETYRMIELEERSRPSHGHYFSVLHEMFLSLPEEIKRDEEWAESEEAMRKHALVKTGFYNSTDYACETKAEAERWATRIKVQDDYAIVLVEGKTVRVFTAKSQSYRGMPTKGEFQRSKEAVLGYLADLLKLPPEAEQRRP